MLDAAKLRTLITQGESDKISIKTRSYGSMKCNNEKPTPSSFFLMRALHLNDIQVQMFSLHAITSLRFLSTNAEETQIYYYFQLKNINITLNILILKISQKINHSKHFFNVVFKLKENFLFKSIWNCFLFFFLPELTQKNYLSHQSLASLVTQTVKCLPAMQEIQVQSLGWKYPLEKEMLTHFSTLACKIL